MPKRKPLQSPSPYPIDIYQGSPLVRLYAHDDFSLGTPPNVGDQVSRRSVELLPKGTALWLLCFRDSRGSSIGVDGTIWYCRARVVNIEVVTPATPDRYAMLRNTYVVTNPPVLRKTSLY